MTQIHRSKIDDEWLLWEAGNLRSMKSCGFEWRGEVVGSSYRMNLQINENLVGDFED
jgi:hypothetical protein